MEKALESARGTEPPAEGSPLEVPTPAGALTWTGERFVSALDGEIRLEHHHRYLIAATLCRGLDVLDMPEVLTGLMRRGTLAAASDAPTMAHGTAPR